MPYNISLENSFLSSSSDIIFQSIFGEPGSEHITSNFLESILHENISNIDLSKNPILRRSYLKDKLGVLDVIAILNNNEICNIELQIAPQPFIIERILFYWSKVFSRQLKSGNHYENLNRTIVILISNFSISNFKSLPCHTSWNIINKENRNIILTNKLEIHIINLKKFHDLNGNDELLLDWLTFLKNPKSERVINAMKSNTALKQANDKLEKMFTDDQLEQLEWLKFKGVLEENTAKLEAFKKGEKQGIKQGELQQKIKIAKEMLNLNIEIEKIAQITKLSIEEINNLQ